MIDRKKAPTVRPFAKMSMPSENKEILDNGITLHTFSGGEQPICHLSIYFAGGASELCGDIAAKIMLACLTDGTATHTADEIGDTIDYNGVRVGSTCHAHYSSLRFSMLNHRIADFLPIASDIIANPIFPDERLETARLRAKAQIETSLQEVSTIADNAFNKLIMGERHPLAINITSDDVDKYTRPYIADMHRQMICPAKAHAFLCGQIDSHIIKAVRDFLQAIPSIGLGYKASVIPYTPCCAGTIDTIPKDDSYQSAIIMGMPAISRADNNYIPLRLSIIALGGYFGSRLMANIREDKGLTYGISAALIGSQEGSYLKIAAQCDKEYTSAVINEVIHELDNLKINPPRGKELERLKLYAATSLAELLDTPSSISGYYATQLLVGTPDNYFELQQRAIDTLTPDIIAEMADCYLRPQNLITVIGGQR